MNRFDMAQIHARMKEREDKIRELEKIIEDKNREIVKLKAEIERLLTSRPDHER